MLALFYLGKRRKDNRMDYLIGLLIIGFIPHTISTFCALYVYDDARKRYPVKIWVYGWMVAVYIAWFFFVWFYLITRPPILFTDISKLSVSKKVLIWLISYPIIVCLILVWVVLTTITSS